MFSKTKFGNGAIFVISDEFKQTFPRDSKDTRFLYLCGLRNNRTSNERVLYTT